MVQAFQFMDVESNTYLDEQVTVAEVPYGGYYPSVILSWQFDCKILAQFLPTDLLHVLDKHLYGETLCPRMLHLSGG